MNLCVCDFLVPQSHARSSQKAYQDSTVPAVSMFMLAVQPLPIPAVPGAVHRAPGLNCRISACKSPLRS